MWTPRLEHKGITALTLLPVLFTGNQSIGENSLTELGSSVKTYLNFAVTWLSKEAFKWLHPQPVSDVSYMSHPETELKGQAIPKCLPSQKPREEMHGRYLTLLDSAGICVSALVTNCQQSLQGKRFSSIIKFHSSYILRKNSRIYDVRAPREECSLKYYLEKKKILMFTISEINS